MALPKHLSRRGKNFQFTRRVPTDVVDAIGFATWRSSLGTDGQAEAERLLRIKLVETDQVIKAVRNGTYQRIDNETLDGLAVDWSIWFEEAASWTLQEAVFGQRFPTVFEHIGKPLSGEIDQPILRTKDELAKMVARFVEERGITITRPSPEWDKLVALCQDEYAASNPEIAGAPHIGAIGPVPKPTKRQLSKAFEKFISERTRKDADHPITAGSIEEFRVGVRRFIDLFGDLDVNKITRSQAQEFRDVLRGLPARPPNHVRDLPLRAQTDWANENNHKLLAKDTVGKLVGGLKSILDHAATNSDFIVDLKSWSNPFLGFTASGKRQHKAERRPYTEPELLMTFSPDTYDFIRPSAFWVPLLLYFTGARRNEIAQLHLTDVIVDGDTPHLNLTTTIAADELDDEEDMELGLTKRIKNWNSDRVAPILAPLIEIGFLKFVEHAKTLGSPHLFVDLPHHHEERRADKLSENFGKYLRKKAGIADTNVVMHSLRHNFSMSCSDFEIQDDERKLTMGHYLEKEVSVENYLAHFRRDAALMKRKVHDRIQFAPLDVSGLAELADEIVEVGPWKPRSRRKNRIKN
jgi:integrase